MQLLSPPGLAGIAILRLAPAEHEAIQASLFGPSDRPVPFVPGAAASRAELRFDGRVVDDVLVVCRTDGSVELHVHGSPAVLEQLDERFSVAVSQPGTTAERLLQEALGVEQFALFAEQMRFDFAAEFAGIERLEAPVRQIRVREALERSRVVRAHIKPQRVVLVGRQNAGKSSLFNKLLFRERALTGALPGLTRDAIAELTTLLGYPYELVDTAGEGVAETDIDQAAIERGRAERKGAMTVLVVDGSVGPDGTDGGLAGGSSLVVVSKADLAQATWPAHIPRDVELSAHATPADVARSTVGEVLRSRRGLPAAGPVGGFAALDEQQLQQLMDLDADCQGVHSSA